MSEYASWIAPAGRVGGTITVAGQLIPTPDLYQSAIALLAVASDNITRLDVDPMTWGLDASRRITWRRAATFSISTTGFYGAVLGLSGSYTGQNSYTGAVAATGVILPRGLRLDGPLWESEAQRPANVSGAVNGAMLKSSSGSLLIDLTWTEAWALETTARGKIYDVAHAGRWAGRGRVVDVTRQRQGLRSDFVTLSLSLQGVF
jgi:hypothetical protein